MNEIRQRIEDRLSAIEENATFADGFDDAIVGLGIQYTKQPIVVYDYHKCIEILMERDGMNEDEAMEFFGFNTQCAWVGEQTPMFVDDCRKD